MLLCLYIDSFFKKLTFITMFLLTVLVLGAKNLQKLPNRYRHLRLSFATYNSDWSKVSDVSEPLRNTCIGFWNRKPYMPFPLVCVGCDWQVLKSDSCSWIIISDRLFFQLRRADVRFTNVTTITQWLNHLCS